MGTRCQEPLKIIDGSIQTKKYILQILTFQEDKKLRFFGLPYLCAGCGLG